MPTAPFFCWSFLRLLPLFVSPLCHQQVITVRGFSFTTGFGVPVGTKTKKDSSHLFTRRRDEQAILLLKKQTSFGNVCEARKLFTQLVADVALLVVASVHFLLDPVLLLFERILPHRTVPIFRFPPGIAERKKTYIWGANLSSPLVSYRERCE